ncbi:Pyocin activator protein PrtN [Variovorax boronicumulans]|uniref:Pyocin activator protein PrtN n=1 Tax=Variovorax boronicumulans TaxID=436515 RepID=A0A250DLW8_9BURK|nr:pyocin activator PrtN family protein [Variovorax boronicumulans]ATA55368.1 Pyocin activator protein PrtN [Variovorax boronicumulans]
MKTFFLLMAQYEARPVIPLEWVQRDFFSHVDVKKLAAKCMAGDIQLPLVRIDPSSQKSQKGVSIQDLAEYLDSRQQAARKELAQILSS